MRRGDVLWTRRRLLGTGAAALAVGCVTPAAPCDAGALTRRVSTIATTDRDQLLPIVARWLAEGVPTDEIAHAAVVAGLDASSLTNHSNHPVKAVEAARVVASEL
ncbi:MAG: hypothetical protein KDA24_26550, partial [Deltaproteobacteria bacterium]|nr:hypothetical protein [Deltaproteobacteria bacterium]